MRLPDPGVLADDLADGLGHLTNRRTARERVPQARPMPPERAADARRERALGPIIFTRVPPSYVDDPPRVDLEDCRFVEACVEIDALVLNRRVILHAIDAMPARWRT